MVTARLASAAGVFACSQVRPLTGKNSVPTDATPADGLAVMDNVGSMLGVTLWLTLAVGDTDVLTLAVGETDGHGKVALRKRL